MKRLLTLAATLTWVTSFASEPSIKESTEATVRTELLKPMAAKESKYSRLSRSRLPPQARRIRVLNTEPLKDKEGAAFVEFAIDSRYGFDLGDGEENAGEWTQNTVTGCVYAETGTVFVMHRGSYHAPGALFGKKTKPAASHICKADPAQVARAP